MEPAMTLSPPPENEPLYKPPGSVVAAQVVAFFQVAFLFGIGSVVATLGSIGGWSLRLLALFTELEAAEAQRAAELVHVGGWTMVGISFLLGVLTWGLGQGKRWAQAAMVAAQALLALAAAAGTAQVGDAPLGFVAVCLLGLPALCAVVSLLSRSANQWFRQGGWGPWYDRYYARAGRRR